MNTYYYYGDKEWEEGFSNGINLFLAIGAITLLEYFLDMPFWQILLIAVGIVIFFKIYIKFAKFSTFGIIGLVAMIVATPLYIHFRGFNLKELIILILSIAGCSFVAWIIQIIIYFVKRNKQIKIFQKAYPKLNIKKSDYEKGIIFNEEKEILYYFDKKKTVIEEIPFSKINSFDINYGTCTFEKILDKDSTQEITFNFPLEYSSEIINIFWYMSARYEGETKPNTFEEYTSLRLAEEAKENQEQTNN